MLLERKACSRCGAERAGGAIGRTYPNEPGCKRGRVRGCSGWRLTLCLLAAARHLCLPVVHECDVTDALRARLEAKWRESRGDTGAKTATQRRKKREARSRALHVELVLLRLWVCKCRSRRCARVGGVAVDVADEFALQTLRRGASEARARTCVRGWQGDGEPSNGGMRTAEYERRRAQSGRGRKEDATRGRRQGPVRT